MVKGYCVKANKSNQLKNIKRYLTNYEYDTYDRNEQCTDLSDFLFKQ